MLNSDEIKKLIEELQSPDLHTRRGAAESFRAAQPPEAVPALEYALHDPDIFVRTTALQAILRIDARHVIGLETLKAFLQDSELDVRWGTVTYMSDLNPFPHEVFPNLLDLLGDQNEKVRLNAAAELGRLAEQKKLTTSERETALEALKGCLSDPEIIVRDAAVEAIGRFIPDGAVAMPELLQSYEWEPDHDMRRAILITFYCLGPGAAPAVPLLARALADKDDGIRYQAGVALFHVGEAAKQVIPQLIKALRDTHDGVRALAMEALANCEEEAAEAIPELERIRDTEEYHNRKIAIAALQKIRS